MTATEHDRMTFAEVYEPGTGKSLDTSMFFHCGELHDRISILLAMLSDKRGLPIIECARCGRLLISQRQDYPSREMQFQNTAMEICHSCTEDMHDRKRTDHLEERMEELAALATNMRDAHFGNGDVQGAKAWQLYADMASARKDRA